MKDFVRGYSGDIFAYIQEARDVSFKDVITVCKEITGITESYSSAPKKELFGGFYSKIKHKVKDEEEIKTYDDSVMDKYTAETQVTSIKVNDFNNSVSGTIRHGDIVNVYAKDPSTNQLVLMV